jgi:hypothetical protein
MIMCLQYIWSKSHDSFVWLYFTQDKPCNPLHHTHILHGLNYDMTSQANSATTNEKRRQNNSSRSHVSCMMIGLSIVWNPLKFFCDPAGFMHFKLVWFVWKNRQDFCCKFKIISSLAYQNGPSNHIITYPLTSKKVNIAIAALSIYMMLGFAT